MLSRQGGGHQSNGAVGSLRLNLNQPITSKNRNREASRSTEREQASRHLHLHPRVGEGIRGPRCCGAGGGTEAVGGGGDCGAAQEASARTARVGSRKPAGRIGKGRKWAAFIGAILYQPAPPHQAGQPVAGVRQIGRRAGSAARPRAEGDRPARRPAAGPDHRQGVASAAPGC